MSSDVSSDEGDALGEGGLVKELPIDRLGVLHIRVLSVVGLKVPKRLGLLTPKPLLKFVVHIGRGRRSRPYCTGEGIAVTQALPIGGSGTCTAACDVAGQCSSSTY